MCARLGIRGVYAQAYHHQANGRAEIQGKIFKNLFSKLLDENPKLNWVEIMPMALRCFLDAPGPTGLSPYEIVHGRHKYRSGIPQEPVRESEDANHFFDRSKKLKIGFRPG